MVNTKQEPVEAPLHESSRRMGRLHNELGQVRQELNSVAAHTRRKTVHVDAIGSQLRRSCLRMGRLYDELGQLRRELDAVQAQANALQEDIHATAAAGRERPMTV